MLEETLTGSDDVTIDIASSDTDLVVRYSVPGGCGTNSKIFVALRTSREIGSAVVPFARHEEGSTVFLPFNAHLLLSAQLGDTRVVSSMRRWNQWRWSERQSSDPIQIIAEQDAIVFRIPHELFETDRSIGLVAYAKNLAENDGWGWFWGCSDRTVPGGLGDKYIPHYHEVALPGVSRRSRGRANRRRVRIYQLFVRLFGNTNETRKRNGTLEENGVGKFADINEAALAAFSEMGFTHIWLTGVLQQATATDYSEVGQPADDMDLLKGLAGSPYAIKDYFDVCPDYAINPAERLKEFRQLIERIHAHELKAIIDLVPNHVARSYGSWTKADCDFGRCGGEAGEGDDREKFFAPHNNFFYLTTDENGPPLRLPTVRDGVALSPTCQLPGAQCDGIFDGEKTFGRVTGNNCVSWTPQLHDWYETIKLNYGFDFTDPAKSIREYPNAWTPEEPLPDTWKKVDQVIAYWQSLGVDGFRCDMAHMVPPEVHSWAIAQARRRQPDVFFMGEAYNDDPAKVPGCDPIVSQLNFGHGNVLFDLLNAGFDAVYDAPAYRALKRLYDGSGWANDIDREISDEFICHNSVRYAENHDEVRLAARNEWGGVGLNVGRPVTAILYGLSRGAIMLYNGQEIGEPGAGAEGFGGDDARTSIFDYWSMPEFVKWVNGHRYDGGRLSLEQKALLTFYGRLINLVGEPAFSDGNFIPLNPANRDNPNFGRLDAEAASGHWLYAFLRYDSVSGQRFLVCANLHPTIALQQIAIFLPLDALPVSPGAKPKLINRLSDPAGFLEDSQVRIARLDPLSAAYFEFVA